jgi:hypothetical protein
VVSSFLAAGWPGFCGKDSSKSPIYMETRLVMGG